MDPIAAGASTGDLGSYWGAPGKEVLLTFGPAGVDYLRRVVSGAIAAGPECGLYGGGCGDAGMLLAPPDEFFGIGPALYGNIRVATDDRPAPEELLRPRLEIDYYDLNAPAEGEGEGAAQAHSADQNEDGQISLFDVYTGEQIPQGKKSLAFRVVFQAPDRTLTEAEISKMEQKILDELARDTGAVLRT